MLLPATGNVRWMIRRDLCFVLEIERSSFDYPWSEGQFLDVLRRRNCIGSVIEPADERVLAGEAVSPVGYMIYELHRDRLNIINFAVHPDCRRQGCGETLLAKLKGKLTPERRTHITVTLGEKNLRGQLFLKAMGFRAVGIEPDFYVDPPEDGYKFRFNCPTASPPPLSAGNRISRHVS